MDVLCASYTSQTGSVLCILCPIFVYQSPHISSLNWLRRCMYLLLELAVYTLHGVHFCSSSHLHNAIGFSDPSRWLHFYCLFHLASSSPHIQLWAAICHPLASLELFRTCVKIILYILIISDTKVQNAQLQVIATSYLKGGKKKGKCG